MANMTEHNGLTNQQQQMHVRFRAYIDFLKACYETDDNGLADMIGCDRGTFKRYLEGDTGKIKAHIFAKLANLTGISIDFLFAFELL